MFKLHGFIQKHYHGDMLIIRGYIRIPIWKSVRPFSI